MASQCEHKGIKSQKTWTQRYSQRHRPIRVTAFPAGVEPPKRVRIYQRNGHHLLQWWDPVAGKTLSDRVDGDVIDAIARARQIDQRLEDSRGSGHAPRRLTHQQLIERFIADLQRRADAGEVTPATVGRYTTALHHYKAFIEQPRIETRFRRPSAVNREFAIELAGYLNALTISPNGHPNTAKRRMAAPGYVLDVVRAMYEWAADPDRGGLLSEGFRNPFRLASVKRQRPAERDLAGEPDITIEMAVEMLRAADDYQLRLFSPMVLWGLRASEPAFMFADLIDGAWLNLGCIDALDYRTKGGRNKRLPIIAPLDRLICQDGSKQGLVLHRRAVVEGKEKPSLVGASMKDLIAEHQRRCDRAGAAGAVQRRTIRDAVLHDAGGLNYDLIQGEFQRLARHLDWPASATLKDLRHLFNVCMENGGLSERERRYLMGQSQGRAAIVHYTHLNKLAEHYRNAVAAEMGPVVEACQR